VAREPSVVAEVDDGIAGRQQPTAPVAGESLGGTVAAKGGIEGAAEDDARR
jgi:hypothetical protein